MATFTPGTPHSILLCSPTYPSILVPSPLLVCSKVIFFGVRAAPAIIKALGTRIPHAPHDCHALRKDDGAHDRGGPMPIGALSVEHCMVVWLMLAAAGGNLAQHADKTAISDCTSPPSSRHTHTPGLTRLARPEIAKWTTRSKWSDANRCPSCPDSSCVVLLCYLAASFFFRVVCRALCKTKSFHAKT